MGIIVMNKDLGPTICENQENAKPGTETQIKFMWFHVKEENHCAGNT